MESVSLAPARLATLPSPSLKRKSPPSTASAVNNKSRESEILGALALAAQPSAAPPPPSDRSASTSPRSAPAEQTPSVDDYEKGLVVCGTCGEGVPFRDPQSGGFTLKLWDLHREQCRSQHAPQSEPIVFTPETTVDTMANPPLKKRRAKRTEEERIEYLRTDPYVAEFEPYRVLCGSCNKWIRLRPNSTYCSIPWDAHRKSCLSKKANTNSRTAVAAEGRNAILFGDPDVRRFDAERVMCTHCDRWIPIRADGSHDALKNWYAHRDECRAKTPPTRLSFRQVLPAENRTIEPGVVSTGGVTAVGGTHLSSPNGSAAGSTQGAHAAHPAIPRPAPHPSLAPTSPSTSTRMPAPSLGPLPAPSFPPPSVLASGSPHTTPSSIASVSASGLGDGSPRAGFKDLHVGMSTQDSRRRNAEQRAASLRADPLLKEVEPNRVFCSLCGKWVQLRQDSSYCAYPWHQHRRKCLARYQRRQMMARDYSHGVSHHGVYDQSLSARYGASAQGPSRPGGDPDADGELEDELESGEDQDARADERESESDVPLDDMSRFVHQRRLDGRAGHPYARPAMQRYADAGANASASGGGARMGKYKLSAVPPAPPAALAGVYDASMDEEDRDADAEGDAADVEMDEDGSEVHERERDGYAHCHNRAHSNNRRRAEAAPSLADLDTPSGRRTFVGASVRHLYQTTYERGADELSVGALVNYLNAAMPADKHEDFDVQEVTRTAAALAKAGALVQEGDRLRPRD